MSQNENVLWRFWTPFGMRFWKLLPWSKFDAEMNSRKCYRHSEVACVLHCWARILYLLAVRKDGLTSFHMYLNHGIVEAVPRGASGEFEVQLSFSLFVVLTLCRRYLNSLCSKCNCKVPDIKCKDILISRKAQSLRGTVKKAFFLCLLWNALKVCVQNPLTLRRVRVWIWILVSWKSGQLVLANQVFTCQVTLFSIAAPLWPPGLSRKIWSPHGNFGETQGCASAYC